MIMHLMIWINRNLIDLVVMQLVIFSKSKFDMLNDNAVSDLDKSKFDIVSDNATGVFL